MENNATELLREIEASLAALKGRIGELEEQVAQYKILAAAQKAAEADIPGEVDFTGMEIGVADLPSEPVSEPAVETPVQAVEPEPVIEPEPVAESEPAPVEPEPAPVEPEPVAEPAPAIDPDPVVAPEPAVEPAPEPAPAVEPKPAAAPKADTARMAWRLDKPGVSVKNIRSGISLYDRALFIGTLFKEDYALYDRTIGELNAMASLDEAVDYLLERFPDWNLKSDIVYNFIMAIRKKLG